MVTGLEGWASRAGLPAGAIRALRRLVPSLIAFFVFAIFPIAANAAVVKVTNGIQFVDTDGNIVHAHGGGVLRQGEYYYWLGENRDGINLVTLYRSKDLKEWEFVAHVIRRDMGGELATANIERPKLLYNEATGQYVMWMHKENGRDYSEGRVAVAVASQIEGPYTYLGSWRPLGFDSRDMTVYNDGGTAYLISASRVNADLHIYRLNAEFTDVEELVLVLWVDWYREAPAVFKRGSTYFMITSGATGWNPNQAMYATAPRMEGPWTDPVPFADSTTYGSQPAFVLTVEGSETTSYLYMGDRWAGAWGGPVNDSRYVWLPLEFPTDTTLAMEWYPTLLIDTETGRIEGSTEGGPFDPDRPYRLISANSGKALDVDGLSLEEGANVQQWGYWAGPNQHWFLQPVGSYYVIRNVNSGLVLQVADASTVNGGNVVQGAYTGEPHQEWSIVYAGQDSYRLVNRHSGKSLDVAGQSTVDGANVHQWDYWGGANQRWHVVPVE